MFHRLLLLLLLWDFGRPTTANASEPPVFEIALDEPVHVTIAGQPAELSFVVGTVDQVTLNDSFVEQLGLRSGATTKADLILDGTSKLTGRRAGAMLEIAGLKREQQLYWLPGRLTLPLHGTIGIMAVPHHRVRLKIGSNEAPLALRMPLAGSVDSTAYGLVNLSPARLAVTLNPSIRTLLPLISSAPGVDLKSVIAGRFTGEEWEEEAGLGIRHKVRRFELAQPLQLGRLQFSALAARVVAMPARQPRPKTGEKPTIVLTLSRAQLEEQGCNSLVVDKQEMSIAFYCTGPASPSNIQIAGAVRFSGDKLANTNRSMETPLAPQTSQGSPSTPISVATAPAISPDGWVELQPSNPLLVKIAGKNVELALDTGDLPGVLLNEVAAMRLGLGSGARQAAITYAGRKTAEASGARETVVALMRGAATNILWLRGYDGELFSGSIELSSLPHDRLRLRLSPEEAGARPVRLKLVVPRGRSSRGATELPGMASFQVDAAIQKSWQLPLVSKSLAADLVKILGGRLEGRPWLETLGYQLRRPVRRLVLAKPLVIGPLSFKAVAVQIGGTPDESNRLARGQDVLPDADADTDPDEIVVTGKMSGPAGRRISLSRTQLAEQRCSSLAVDKPASIWELICRGPA
ncbi:hypothetical protein GCM10007973_08380 [Polymorphobacter multimanifer]|uniref:Uncharacterized protein n=1 Tax=Polymorphobacter multimanifer TaxID=1070431 RepID=A0A841L8I7_9SPHN|nr:hypothetical protein [Polymorphobacter multimanifer]MBB6228947.1 hypothetical protein [Polymorphobacter multimanifer]GGI73874.1 hypothetical protein GCM10007973_08380 [Polymorphobacter multimanifer]